MKKEIIIKLEGQEIYGILNMVSEDKIILYAPGSNGKFQGEDFDYLEKELEKKKISFLRFRMRGYYEGDNLDNYNFEIIRKDIERIIAFLRKEGFSKIGIIGKSMAAIFLLLPPIENIKSLVLWAPAISLSEKSNLSELKNKSFSEIKSSKEFSVDSQILKQIKYPVMIINGDNDPTVKWEASKKLAEKISESKFQIIKGAEHSYKEKIWKRVCDKTISFLESCL